MRTDTNSLAVDVVGGQEDYENLVRAGSAMGLRRNKIPEGKFANDYGYMTVDGQYPDAATFAVWYSFCSTQCKRVKVGTELIERDVFEVQCVEPEREDPAAAM